MRDDGKSEEVSLFMRAVKTTLSGDKMCLEKIFGAYGCSRGLFYWYRHLRDLDRGYGSAVEAWRCFLTRFLTLLYTNLQAVRAGNNNNKTLILTTILEVASQIAKRFHSLWRTRARYLLGHHMFKTHWYNLLPTRFRQQSPEITRTADVKSEKAISAEN